MEKLTVSSHCRDYKKKMVDAGKQIGSKWPRAHNLWPMADKVKNWSILHYTLNFQKTQELQHQAGRKDKVKWNLETQTVIFFNVKTGTSIILVCKLALAFAKL